MVLCSSHSSLKFVGAKINFYDSYTTLLRCIDLLNMIPGLKLFEHIHDLLMLSTERRTTISRRGLVTTFKQSFRTSVRFHRFKLFLYVTAISGDCISYPQARARLNRFDGQASISSEDYFGDSNS